MRLAARDLYAARQNDITMEERAVAVLLARLRAGEPPISVRDLLTLLALPKTEKSRLNKLLYTTATAHAALTNPLALPRQYRLVLHKTTPPQWSAIRKADDPHAPPRARCAWAVYEVLAAHPGAPVATDAVLAAHPHAATATHAAECLREHALAPAESVSVTQAGIVLHATAPPPDDRVVLNCDAIVGRQRNHAQCVVLGMAIHECMTANPGKQVALLTLDPGTHAVLRHVLKTDEYARSLDIVVVPLPAAPPQ